MPPSTERTLTLCTSRTRGTAERGGVRALAHVGLALERLDVDDDVRLGQRVLHRLLDRVGRRVALADGGVRRDADDDVGEVAARRLAHPQPAQVDRRA